MIDSTQSMPQQQGSYKFLLIDGDTIAYVVGWNLKDNTDPWAVEVAVDELIGNLLRATNAGAYLGIIGPEDSSGNFRKEIYKVKAYKGNRPESPEWIIRCKPIVEKRLLEHHKFVRAPHHLETDDVIVSMAMKYYNVGFPAKVGVHLHTLICSPDKDIKQTPGEHYDYKKGETVIVLPLQAERNLTMQLLTGDTTDNIMGVPKFGPVKAQKLLDETDPLFWSSKVRAVYDDYYGSYYGPILFAENQAVVMMMQEAHPLWRLFGFDITAYAQQVVVLN